MERLRRFRNVCDEAIGSRDIVVCIENYGICHDFQKEGIDLLLESPHFSLTYDIGHDCRSGGKDERFILDRASRLRHMHIHDATKEKDHLALGAGEADILQKLRLAEATGCRCVIEVKTPEALRKSVAYLRENIRPQAPAPAPEPAGAMQEGVTAHSSNSDKTALFLSLFCGRRDVYARRWQSRDGQKSGYVPACKNEWKRGLCNKPKIKCANCGNRVLIPLNENVIAQHLAGREIIGVYPMLDDDVCRFLAVDFDGGAWQGDVTAFRDACRDHNIPVAVERSRSGDGAHAWIFFSEAIPAATARKLGTALLTAAMNNRHEIKFTSYDRLFPNQDIMPKGGFGNLIALPLQRGPRANGNSVFVDEDFRQYDDQWAYLSSRKQLSAADTASLLHKLCKGGELGILRDNDDNDDDDKPWMRKAPEAALAGDDFPAEIDVVEAHMLCIRKAGMSQRALNRLKRLAAFKNPEFYKAQAMRFPTWDKPRVICVAEETEKYLCLPRGCKAELEDLLCAAGTRLNHSDARNAGTAINVSFNGVLREEQLAAQNALLAEENGVLSATTAFGKTVVAASLIAERKINTLVLVDRRPLLDQWKERLTEFLTIDETLPAPEKKRGRKKERSIIGVLGGGKNVLSGIVDIAVMQSLTHDGEVKAVVKNYGMVIVDECHHVSAVSFERILKETNARFVYGLTATPKRRDGHHPIIVMHCGPIRYRDDAKLQAARRPFDHYIIPRFTAYRLPIDKTEADMAIQSIYSDLCQNESRNSLIVDDVAAAVSEGRNPLILTERTVHVDLLSEALEKRLSGVIVLTGGQTAAERRRLAEMIAAVPPSAPLIIIATGKYVGEGFDAPRLDTLFLAMPIAWQGTLSQYAGRLHRLHDEKTEVQIYDYVDIHVGVLDRMYAKRVKGYAAIGYKAKCEGQLPKGESILFDSSNFISVFESDLHSAKREIIIVSPFLAKRRMDKMLPLLKSAVQSGVNAVIFTRPPRDYKDGEVDRIANLIKILRDAGADVVERAKIHQKFTVMDGRIVWYGSINLLSFGATEESIMRFESVNIAGELSAIMRE